MRVLGVDPGLRRCGWAVLAADGGGATALGYGAVMTSGDDAAARLAQLAERLREVLTTHQPDCLAIERLFVNANVRTAMTVGQASGVALLLAAERGLPVTSYTPSQVKRAVTGTGTAPKEQVGYMVRALLRLEAAPSPADAADAAAVALCHLHHAGLATRAGAGAGLGAADPDGWLARAAPTSPGLARAEGRGGER